MELKCYIRWHIILDQYKVEICIHITECVHFNIPLKTGCLNAYLLAHTLPKAVAVINVVKNLPVQKVGTCSGSGKKSFWGSGTTADMAIKTEIEKYKMYLI